MSLNIAFANHKGGVAKTTSVAALGTIFAESGYRVLMIDLDAQGSLTHTFVDPSKTEVSRFLFDAIRERKSLPRIAVRNNLYLCPNELEMAFVEGEWINMRRREYVLQDLILPIEKDYDLILFDCPPAFLNATLNALVVADRLCVPVFADQYSFDGIEAIINHLQRVADVVPHIKINDIFFTRFNGATNMAKTALELFRTKFPDELMNTVVRHSVKAQEAVCSFQSVVEYNPSCTVSEDYYSLAKELSERINKDAETK